MLDKQTLFTKLLAYTGKEVVVGTISSGEKLSGIVKNAMFDSFILDTNSGRRIIAFNDIKFLDALPQGT